MLCSDLWHRQYKSEMKNITQANMKVVSKREIIHDEKEEELLNESEIEDMFGQVSGEKSGNRVTIEGENSTYLTQIKEVLDNPKNFKRQSTQFHACNELEDFNDRFGLLKADSIVEAVRPSLKETIVMGSIKKAQGSVVMKKSIFEADKDKNKRKSDDTFLGVHKVSSM